MSHLSQTLESYQSVEIYLYSVNELDLKNISQYYGI